MSPKLFYKNCFEESCVSHVSQMFTSLGNKDKVCASLAYSSCGDSGGISDGSMMGIHNHLDSSKIWKKTVPWVTEVEYTIPHPSGDTTAFDTNSGADAKLSRKSVVSKLTGRCEFDTGWRISITRTSDEPSDKMDFKTTRWTWVKVMNVKRFHYETSRSSWVFKLVVSWEGVTKEDAKAGAKKYVVYVESVDNVKTSSNPSYSAASFLDKILDIISLDGRRQTLTLD